MKRIKVIIFVLAMALAAVLCGSCGDQADELVQFLSERVERVDEGIKNLICDSHKKEDQKNELVRCLNERDEEGIMNLLCEKTRTSSDIDLEQQISDFFNLLGDRKITSYNWRQAYEEEHWREGKQAYHDAGFFIEEIELSDGSDEIEFIVFATILAYEDNQDRVGLEWFYARCDEKEYWVGEEVD